MLIVPMLAYQGANAGRQVERRQAADAEMKALAEVQAAAERAQKKEAPVSQGDGSVSNGEQEFRFPGGGALVRVNVAQRAKDNSETKIGEELVFQLPDDVYGDLRLRWRAFPPDDAKRAGQWTLQLVQGHDDFAIKEFAGRFETPVRFSTKFDGNPKSLNSKPHELYKPDQSASLNFLRASEIVEDGKPVENWWDVRAHVQFASPMHKGVVPEFRVPSPKNKTEAGR